MPVDQQDLRVCHWTGIPYSHNTWFGIYMFFSNRTLLLSSIFISPFHSLISNDCVLYKFFIFLLYSDIGTLKSIGEMEWRLLQSFDPKIWNECCLSTVLANGVSVKDLCLVLKRAICGFQEIKLHTADGALLFLIL